MEVVEVVNEGRVRRGREEEFRVVVGEGFVLDVGRECMGSWFVLRESDVISGRIVRVILGRVGREEFVEEWRMVSRESEV